MAKQNVGIIGYGVVGQATANGLKQKGDTIYFYDKYRKDSLPIEEVARKSDIIFLCLPTPYKRDQIDLSIIDENIEKLVPFTDNTEKVVVVKSTVVPTTTENYAKKYPKTKFAFNPEFLTEAHAFDDFINADRIVVGSNDEKVSKKIADFYKKRFPKIPVYISDSKTAEMVKYMANCFLATKVIFANEIYDLCKKLSIDYPKVKEMVLADKRFGKSHFDITEIRGFGGKCFPKDIIAIMGLFKKLGVDDSLLKTVWEKNLKIRKYKDWEEIPFVKSA